MPKPDDDERHIIPEEANTVRRDRRPEEPMDEEEKVMAGRADANIPAMLTKDVPGG